MQHYWRLLLSHLSPWYFTQTGWLAMLITFSTFSCCCCCCDGGRLVVQRLGYVGVAERPTGSTACLRQLLIVAPRPTKRWHVFAASFSFATQICVHMGVRLPPNPRTSMFHIHITILPCSLISVYITTGRVFVSIIIYTWDYCDEFLYSAKSGKEERYRFSNMTIHSASSSPPPPPPNTYIHMCPWLTYCNVHNTLDCNIKCCPWDIKEI